MSSSRDQISLTGVPGISLAIATAWRTQSCTAPRRPKPPPRWILWTSHLRGRQARGLGRGGERRLAVLGRRPDLAALRRPQRRRVHRLHGGVVLVGVGVDRLDRLGGRRRAPRGASPAWLPTKASSASSPSFSMAAIVALETPAFGPSSHSIGSASSAVLACHQVSATTATAVSPTCTTCLHAGHAGDRGGVEARAPCRRRPGSPGSRR